MPVSMLSRSGLGRALRPALAVPQRSFSVSPATQIDISSLYSRLTSFRRKQPKSEVVDPTKVDSAKTADDTLTQDSRPRKLTVLGKPRSLEDDWPHVRKFAEFTPWPTNHHRKDLSENDIDAALADIGSANFADIASRFEAVKAVSQRLSISVPDAVLSKTSSAADLRTHLLSVARPFDERQPDAIYLDPKDFEGTNVIISDPVAERRQQKRSIRELVQQARAAQKAETDNLLAQSRQAAA